MFNPTRDQSRDFLFDVWRKHGEGAPLTPLESMALDIVLQHPEYHAVLGDRERYHAAEYPVDAGRTNPFLHLSMHLAIGEQVSIDQPPGIRAAVEKLAAHRGSLHEAAHDVMDCLAEIIWQAQRNGTGFDNATYLESLHRNTR